MFSDPQTVTINAVPFTLPRVDSGGNKGIYQSNDGLVKLSVSHTYGKRNRRMLRLDHSKIAADPLLADRNLRYSMSVYTVFDTPIVGYTVAEAKLISDALNAYAAASSGAQITKILGGES
jgi:hypothetical protein